MAGNKGSPTTTALSVFTYALESAPDTTSIIITPLFYWTNGTVLPRSLGLTATPPTATFAPTATSSQLTGKFYVNVATSTLSASIVIRLGVSVGEYTGGMTTVTIVGSGEPLPAPILLR